MCGLRALRFTQVFKGGGGGEAEAPAGDEAILEKVGAPCPRTFASTTCHQATGHSLIAMPVPVLNHAEFAT